jgi:hypothetical protein
VRSLSVRKNVAEADDIERSLAIAREAMLPPAGAQERVRAQVAKGRALDTAAGARVASPRGVTKWTTTVLVGASFLAGYWLGLHRSDVSSEGAPVAALPTLSPTLLPTASPTLSLDLAQGSESARQSGADGSSPREDGSRGSLPLDVRSPERGVEGAASGVESAVGSSAGAAGPGRSTPQPATLAPADPRLARAPLGRAVLSRRARPEVEAPLDELTLLSRVERALRAGEAALALTFLDELDRRVPRSTLLEERSAARRLADCMLEAPGAPARAAQFLREHRASVYSARLQSTCALGASDDGVSPANRAEARER